MAIVQDVGGEVRDNQGNFQKQYNFVRNGKYIDLGESHYDPIFFAQKVTKLKSNDEAQDALKRF